MEENSSGRFEGVGGEELENEKRKRVGRLEVGRLVGRKK